MVTRSSRGGRIRAIKAQPLFKDLTKSEFTYQLSDHLPLWVQINTDTDEQKLEQLIQG